MKSAPHPLLVPLLFAFVVTIAAGRMVLALEAYDEDCIQCATTCQTIVQGDMQIPGGGGGTGEPPTPGSVDATYCNPGLCTEPECNFCINCAAGDIGWFGCSRSINGANGCQSTPYCGGLCCSEQPNFEMIPVTGCSAKRCRLRCPTAP